MTEKRKKGIYFATDADIAAEYVSADASDEVVDAPSLEDLLNSPNVRVDRGSGGSELPGTDTELTDLPDDWELFSEPPADAPRRVEHIPDALTLSLCNRGKVDIGYICSLTGESREKVITALKGKIFEDPEREEWVTGDEYLSGNIKRKLRAAKDANARSGGRYRENVRALNKALPPALSADEIFITLGSPWVPTEIIDAFIEHLVNEKAPAGMRKEYAVRHDEATGIWEIPRKTRFFMTKHTVKARRTYGSSRMDMLHLMENTLNMRTIAIMDEEPNPRDPKKTVQVLNQVETAIALERQAKMVEEFKKWVWSDPRRKSKLVNIYEERYASIVKHHYDGSFLRFPELASDMQLFPYQKNAVARILFTPNTLLAHDVGSGKTYIMVAAGMELRRMGISKKNLYVVPNNLVGQWEALFIRMYPSAKVLTVDPASFTPLRREQTMALLRDGDFDGIIMAYSCFDKIPLSIKYYEECYTEDRAALRESDKVFASKGIIDRKQRSLTGAFTKAGEECERNADRICFDTLGINTLFVDEAHNYKNVPVDSKIEMVYGLAKNGSKKCRAMLEKVRCIHRQTGGRGVVFATGTPITNSITDIFVMQKYLQSGELSLLGLGQFDSWVGMFAEKEPNFEIDVDTSNYRVATRFSTFHNLRELTAILSSIADFHRNGASENGIPLFEGYTDIKLSGSLRFREYLGDISRRADDVRHRRVHREDDNMLKITGDGRKAALDLRLVLPDAAENGATKALACARNIRAVYEASRETSGTQLVFCDTSTPKRGFNIYDELRSLLIGMGIPEEQIAYVHEVGDSARKRDALFERVRRGEIRILIGSTFKLGMGVNVQNRLIAVHHLDVPWRPADMIQREGRILRQGNGNPQVYIYRYITEGSFDAYSWQLLETKQRFIEDLLAGSLEDQMGDDVDSTALNYAEIKALAIGNPLIKRRVETANELVKLCMLHRAHAEDRERMQSELESIPGKLAHQRELLRLCEADIAACEEEKREYTPEEAREIRDQVEAAIRRNAFSAAETVAITYRGFKVVVPAYMPMDKPYVFLERNGKYYLPLGAEAGMVRRMDFFLDNLSRQRDNYKDNLKKLRAQERALKAELLVNSGYSDRIAELKAQLKQIDEELGVPKDE